MKTLGLLAIIGLTLVSGCVSHQRAGDRTPAPLANPAVPPDEASVIELARQAVAANDTWLERAEFERPQRRIDGSWSIVVWRIPKVPGGHRLIVIDENGRVIAYVRGA